MTDNEILKVLECCHNGTCSICPYVNEGYCGRRMISGSLDLIKRQQAEIEMLKAEQPTGINELLVIVEDDIRAEAIKEFADKLNSGFFRDHIYNGSYVLGLIEAIAKGMVGDNNES